MKKRNEDITIHPFQRLQGELRSLIAITEAGDKLPAEPELARRLGVSRATLREAMRSFEGQGLIRRRQGIGTFVVGHAHVIESGLEVLESIETLARRIQLEVSMGALHVSQVTANPAMAAVLQVEQVKASEEVATALNVPEGTLLTRVSRVIYTENRPIAYLVDTLPGEVNNCAENINKTSPRWISKERAISGEAATACISAREVAKGRLPRWRSKSSTEPVKPCSISAAARISSGNVSTR